MDAPPINFIRLLQWLNCCTKRSIWCANYMYLLGYGELSATLNKIHDSCHNLSRKALGNFKFQFKFPCVHAKQTQMVYECKYFIIYVHVHVCIS